MSKSCLYLSMFAALAAAFGACSGDQPDEADVVPAGFIIKAPTRTSVDPSNDNERITSWWMAFVGASDRKVRAIASRDPSRKDAVEQETVDCDIPAGTYDVYAFANLSQAELFAATGLKFVVGETVGDDMSKVVYKDMTNNFDKTKPLPMSGWKSVTVTGRVTEPFAIEVVRMLGKVEFVFSNDATTPITVGSVSLGPLNTGNMPLLPDYDLLGSKPDILDEAGTETLVYAFPEGSSLAVGAQNGLTDYFYVRESVADGHPTGHFLVSVKIKRGDKEEESLYSLAGELTYINRNDYVRIPITFTDYLLDVDVLFYPPIGGYPAVIKEEKDNEYYIKFGTQGRFVITPRVRKAADGSPYLSPAEIEGLSVTVKDDPSGIFSVAPSYDESTGEIIGELGSGTGTAEVVLSLSIRQSETVTHHYERKIYIIRENV